MKTFAKLNSNNKVLRIVYTCNQDVADNGGDLSEQAAKHLEKVIPFPSFIPAGEKVKNQAWLLQNWLDEN